MAQLQFGDAKRLSHAYMISALDREEALRTALKESGVRCFHHIRRSVKVDDMTFAQRPLIESSPKSAACIDYRRFVGAYVAQEGGKARGKSTTRRRRTHGTMKGGAING